MHPVHLTQLDTNGCEYYLLGIVTSVVVSHSLSASKTAGSLLALLWVHLGTLGVSMSLDTNSASMPHMCELGFETPGEEV